MSDISSHIVAKFKFIIYSPIDVRCRPILLPENIQSAIDNPDTYILEQMPTAVLPAAYKPLISS
jgi:hypothetical protein